MTALINTWYNSGECYALVQSAYWLDCITIQFSAKLSKYSPEGRECVVLLFTIYQHGIHFLRAKGKKVYWVIFDLLNTY